MLNSTNMILRRLKRTITITTEKLLVLYYLLTHRKLAKLFSIPSHLTHLERIKLYKLSKHKETILEIGSYTGCSACCFGAALKEQGYGKLICIDTWNNDSMTEGTRNTWDEFKTNTLEYSSIIIPIKGFSTNVVKAVEEITRKIDILFIDGDHSYIAVKADWETYKAFLRPGSIVIFHDYGWADGIKKLVHEDVAPLVSNNENLSNMWWGKIGQVL